MICALFQEFLQPALPWFHEIFFQYLFLVGVTDLIPPTENEKHIVCNFHYFNNQFEATFSLTHCSSFQAMLRLVDDENFRVISQQIGSLCVCYYPQVHAHFAPVFLQLTTEKILAWLYGIFVIHPWQMTLFRTHFFIPQFLFRLMNGIDAAAKL